VRGIFLKFMVLTSLVVVMAVGVWLPKAIPHFQHAPYGSEAYVNALFKAFLYINVHYLKALPSQFRYVDEPFTTGNAKISGTS
jgi:hypothetical protein